MDDVEGAAREAITRAYGPTARIEVIRSAGGGTIRVVDAEGRRVAGWYWEVTSLSQRTEAQAWHAIRAIRAIADDDERAVSARRSAS